MLKVNVGLSRKLSKDYNSIGFSINIEGEVPAPPNDAEAVVNGVRELYELAEEALDLQIERYQGESAIASRDRETPPPRSHTGANDRTRNGNGRSHRTSLATSDEREAEPATHKQINYLLSLSKRQRLSTLQLEQQIEEILGQAVGVYDLTKREAARVIDDFAGERTTTGRR